MIKGEQITKRTRFTVPVAGIEVTVEAEELDDGNQFLWIEIATLRMSLDDWLVLRDAVDQLAAKVDKDNG